MTPSSRRCRLFEGDLTTGSMIPSASATSVVGTMVISPSMFAQSHAQPCQACVDSRYEICDANTSTCQCRPHSFWNKSTCAMQLFANETCSQVGSCRSDLNLTCVADFIGQFRECAPGTYCSMVILYFTVGGVGEQTGESAYDSKGEYMHRYSSLDILSQHEIEDHAYSSYTRYRRFLS